MSIFLGGTGSANELHDYEEGTWTPTFPNGGSFNVVYGRYVKYGRLVWVNFEISATQPTANNSPFRIGGLPFTNNSYSHGFGNLGYVGSGTPAGVQLMPLVVTNGTYIYFHRQDGTANHWTNNQYRGEQYNQNLIMGHIYETDA